MKLSKELKTELKKFFEAKNNHGEFFSGDLKELLRNVNEIVYANKGSLTSKHLGNFNKYIAEIQKGFNSEYESYHKKVEKQKKTLTVTKDQIVKHFSDEFVGKYFKMNLYGIPYYFHVNRLKKLSVNNENSTNDFFITFEVTAIRLSKDNSGFYVDINESVELYYKELSSIREMTKKEWEKQVKTSIDHVNSLYNGFIKGK